MSLYGEVIRKVTDGTQITFTKDNVAKEDNFLIFSAYDKCVVTFHMRKVPYWLEFSNDEPMLLEEVPETFLRSILKNAE